jgi:hypothetical protein
MHRSRRRAALDLTLICLAVILLLGTALRLRNLTSSPGWFRDEGVYMEVAWNAAHGEARLGPINHTWVSPFQTIPPLYPLASGMWMRTIGTLRGDERPNIQTLRWFNVGCGLLVIVGAHGLGLALGSPLLGLLAAALLAFDPLTVMFHRMGLPYNMLAIEIVAALGLAHLYFREPSVRRLIAPTLIAAMAPLTIYYGITLPLALILGVALAGRQRDLWLPSLAILPLALFLCGLWWVHPLGLEADWAQFRADSSGTWSLADWTQDFRDLFATTPLIILGLIGLLMLRRGGVSLVTQLTVLIYLFLWLRRPHNNIWIHRPDLPLHMPVIIYPLIPLLPLLALGASRVLLTAWHHLRGDTLDGQAPGTELRLRVVNALFGAAVVVTLCLMANVSIRAIHLLPSPLRSDPPDLWGFESPLAHDLAILKSEAQGWGSGDPGVSGFLWSQGVEPEELVIAEYPLWWTLPGRHATLTQSLASLGRSTDFFAEDMPRERFLYPCDWREARFVILDPMTERWRAEFDPAVREAVLEIRGLWRLVHRSGRLSVYAPRVREEATDSLFDPVSWESPAPPVTSVEASP